MKEVKKETLKKLDDINFASILKQISVGNLVRGMAYMLSMFGEVKRCLSATSEQIKVKMAVQEELERENARKSSKKKK